MPSVSPPGEWAWTAFVVTGFGPGTAKGKLMTVPEKSHGTLISNGSSAATDARLNFSTYALFAANPTPQVQKTPVHTQTSGVYR